MNDATMWHWLLIGTYVAVILLLSVYGMHRYQLVYLYYKYRRNEPKLRTCFRELPHVTVQLPMFNENMVAERVIEATCALEYPRDKLEIQVLDDSTDETTSIAERTVERMRALGHNINLVHRDNRTGYKAGALAEAMDKTSSDIFLIFDADFLPPPQIIHEAVHYFADPNVGMVQARWEHLNRDQSLLTRTQAVMLDGHFVIEHTARNRSGRFMSFNGTAGMWRRRCIEDAGGWEHDTLTEDLDLSYRAQMKGWKFVYLKDLTSPAELPPEMLAFKSQQARWAKGAAQTARKLLPKILRSRLPWRVKLEAFFHLTGCTSYIWMVILTFLLLPVLNAKMWIFQGRWERALFDASVLLMATFSAASFYVASQREIFRTWYDSLKYTPFLMALGIGVSLSNAIAVAQGLLGHTSEFVRTPKYGQNGSSQNASKVKLSGRTRKTVLAMFEVGTGLYMAGCVWVCLTSTQSTAAVPFLTLFAVGYFYVGVLSLLTIYGNPLSAHQPQPVEELAANATESDELAPQNV